MKKIIILITQLISTCLFAQQPQKIIAKFINIDGTVNGEDFTPTLLEQGAYTVFYTHGNDSLFMANYWPKNGTQSTGTLQKSKTALYNQKYGTYTADIFYFNWNFKNDYDSIRGTASVQITRVYKSQGVAVILKIIPENSDLIIYNGYMEGIIDFSVYH